MPVGLFRWSICGLWGIWQDLAGLAGPLADTDFPPETNSGGKQTTKKAKANKGQKPKARRKLHLAGMGLGV
jgi:hypothetical protein